KIKDLNAVLAVVCGKNESFYNESMKLKEKHPESDFFVFGFVDFIHELLSISHTVITKCGASTMMEILLANKVPVVNSYIWEQEKGNIEFLIEKNLGIYEPEIKKLVEVIK